MLEQSLDRALGQHGAKAKGHIGGVEHLIGGKVKRLGQALAAKIRRGGKARPSAFSEGLIGDREAGGRAHLAVLEGGAVLVALAVQGRQFVVRKARRGLQDGGHQVRVAVGKGASGEKTVKSRLMVKGEGKVASRCGEGHG